LVASKYAPSRALSFDVMHVFKTLQLIEEKGHVSRDILRNELTLGEGTIRTLLRHLKMENLIESSNAGTKLTKKGHLFFSVILKQMSSAVKSGIEQRDAAIKMDAIGATTLIFRNGKFLLAGTKLDALRDDHKIRKLLMVGLNPIDEDVIIIGSDSVSEKRAEFAAKNAALLTIKNHEKHDKH
jgi:predicted transcriptional regulator